eukprot:gene948-1334_t
MVTDQRDVFYYVTLMNENYAQPDLPAGTAEGVMRGCYVFRSYSGNMHQRDSAISSKSVTLMGSGAILTEVVKAAEQLASEGVDVTVLSVTSWSELARDGVACEQRWLAGDAQPAPAWLTQQLATTRGPVIAATDYVRAVPETGASTSPWAPMALAAATRGQRSGNSLGWMQPAWPRQRGERWPLADGCGGRAQGDQDEAESERQREVALGGFERDRR